MSHNATPKTSRVELRKTLTLIPVVMMGLAYMQPMTLFDTFGIVSGLTDGHVATAYAFALIAILFTALSYGKLEHDSCVLENRRGRTSHEHFPALITGSRAFSEMQGEVWGVHLGWSGNHRLRAEAKTDGRRYIQAEALYLPGEMAIEEGDTLWTPRLYASYSPRGLNGMSQSFHRYLRDNVIRFPENKPRPVHLNT